MSDSTLRADSGSATSLWPALGARPVIPDYDLLTPIGKGGFGEVWLARQKLTGVLYALKVVPRGQVSEIELEGIRLHKQRCRGQPHVVPIEHVGETPDALYYVMELADDARGPGTHDPMGYQPMTLKEHLARTGPLPLQDAVAITLEILDGLGVLHAAGLLHRDIKPANVMRHAGRWKLGDLGLVAEQSRVSGNGSTPAYAPPGGVVDRGGDLYCVGRVLCELLLGRPPDRTTAARESLLRGEIEDVRARACHAQPQARFQSAAAMQACLRRAATAPWRRRASLLAPVLSVIALIAGLLVWFAARRPLQDPTQTGGPPEFAVFFKQTRAGPEFALSPTRVPLQTGYLLRAEVRLPHPAYPYLYLLFENDPNERRFPDKTARASFVRVAAISDPPPPNENERNYLELTPPAGVAAYLLLVADAPVTDLDALDTAVSQLRLTGSSDTCSLWIGNATHPERLSPQDRGVASQTITTARSTLHLQDSPVLSQFAFAHLFAFPYVQAEDRIPQQPQTPQSQRN